jgi:hypothetical protein
MKRHTYFKAKSYLHQAPLFYARCPDFNNNNKKCEPSKDFNNLPNAR